MQGAASLWLSGERKISEKADRGLSFSLTIAAHSLLAWGDGLINSQAETMPLEQMGLSASSERAHVLAARVTVANSESCLGMIGIGQAIQKGSCLASQEEVPKLIQLGMQLTPESEHAPI